MHARESEADAESLWRAALSVRVGEVGLLGRLIRWRIPGTKATVTFDELFRQHPFILLEGGVERALVSGLVGRIWTLRRDYPALSDPQEFRGWSTPGTARVVFANWVEPDPGGRNRLVSEVRVDTLGIQGRVGLRAVSPLISTFHNRIGSDGIEAAVRRAEGR